MLGNGHRLRMDEELRRWLTTVVRACDDVLASADDEDLRIAAAELRERLAVELERDPPPSPTRWTS